MIAAALFALESSFTTPAGTTVLAKTTLLRVGKKETTETSSRDETCEDKFIKKKIFYDYNKADIAVKGGFFGRDLTWWTHIKRRVEKEVLVCTFNNY